MKGLSMHDDTKFHWAEGMKYVSEGLKGLFLLNGAATISILTFIGNTKANSTQLVIAMLSFALGAATSPLAFLFAYLTQLNYGKAASMEISNVTATRYHYITYFFVALGLLLFLHGVFFAALGLGSFQFSKS